MGETGVGDENENSKFMKTHWKEISAGAVIILLLICYFVLEPKVTPLTLSIGRVDSLSKGSQYVAPSSETALGCNTKVQRGTALFTEFFADVNGFVTVTTDDTDAKADTVVRIKRNNTTDGQKCDDDISATDKRSKISKWEVKAKTPAGTRIKYKITIGLKTNTTEYPLKYSVVLSDK